MEKIMFIHLSEKDQKKIIKSKDFSRYLLFSADLSGADLADVDLNVANLQGAKISAKQ